jgi:hypothetical protein
MSPVPAQSDQASTPARTSPLEAGRNSLISELPTTQISPVAAGAERSANRESSASERITFKPLITNTERYVPNTVDATELEKRPARQVETAGSPRFLAGAEAVINARQLVVGSSRAPTEQNRPGAARDSFAPDRRTDEIEIHIGRIEVTAIHPPAPKEPKVRDKELSLDAYLKRRGGRAG